MRTEVAEAALGHLAPLAETSWTRRGSCYPAAGWVELGQTRGYA